MKVIQLNASAWQSPDNFYFALLPELGAPDWHGHNLDALYDGLRGGINRLEPPFVVEDHRAATVAPEMRACLMRVVAVFDDARQAFDSNVVFVLVE